MSHSDADAPSGVRPASTLPQHAPDWDSNRGEKARHVEPPASTQLATCWRLKAPSGRIITC
jgi:hypothetical protein